MTTPRPRKTHWGERDAACGDARAAFYSHNVDDVTCRVCVYRAWRLGRVRDDDGRITAAMREHRREAGARSP